MIAEELINQMIPPLKPTDKASKALQWMEELRVSQLPVITENRYVGLVSEDIIYQQAEDKALVADLELFGNDAFVNYDQHFYDILRTASAYATEVVVVLSREGNFLGAVTLNDTLLAFAETVSMQETGGILVLLIDSRDYSLSEISRLVEADNAKILSTHIARDKEDYTKIRLTLKINKTDLNRVVATLERFNYRIIAKFQSAENQDYEKERIDMLLKYLDI